MICKALLTSISALKDAGLPFKRNRSTEPLQVAKHTPCNESDHFSHRATA